MAYRSNFLKPGLATAGSEQNRHDSLHHGDEALLSHSMSGLLRRKGVLISPNELTLFGSSYRFLAQCSGVVGAEGSIPASPMSDDPKPV